MGLENLSIEVKKNADQDIFTDHPPMILQLYRQLGHMEQERRLGMKLNAIFGLPSGDRTVSEFV